jgi:hypothetical protein
MSVVIPKSVVKIIPGAFSGCLGLTSVEVHPENTAYASDNGVLFNRDMTKARKFN